MARKKQYIEEQVIEKAMALFWREGYETTSMQMLEKEMGINKFSIYASFGNKDGVFLESIKCYRQKIKEITEKLKVSSNGIKGLKQYFYDFIEFSKDATLRKGCLITNAANELSQNANPKIKEELSKFTNNIRSLFANNLKQEENFNSTEVEEKADYLIISMFGLASASRVFNDTQLHNYIENIFKSI
ncbi:TetR/AcrR family transcriptional regulator [Aquimarina sp. BL5]|uniref:TetR/AcrR family transcriptional regulator n=1 Tax=Aquimarina sp. BL5 TaxID=1714860 RepID=UPI000E4C90AA|nr:TetR/AcrR family transcriptional regulator [Aquimarina sp. BL5]AXT50888.1 TetR/AcrR family transcriptional regulator [Aquimarina sp. BL5]RKN02529.1 TetR family transcriptional regulator [Aquimarina sp. BL5]